jgi:hypothetical protein
VKGKIQTAVVVMWILVSSITTIFAATKEPSAFDKFFRSLRHAFSEPHQPPRTHSSKQKSKSASATDGATAGATPTATPTESPGATAPPNDRNTRTTMRVASKRGDDFRYGIPVPGRKGFVTSPFSPDSGYIDVRGFQPGTPVKDPYSGKIILTP